MKQKLHILQVNTLDIVGGGGASKIAWELFKTYKQQNHKSSFAVGRKQINDPDVFEIPKDAPATRWQKFWFYMEKGTKPFLGKIKGFGLLKKTFHNLAWPQTLVDSLRGAENFNFSGTKKLLELPYKTPHILHLHNLHTNYFDLRLLPYFSNHIPTVITLHDSWLLSGHCAHSFACEKWKTGCGNCPDLHIYPTLKRDSTRYNWNQKANIYANSKLYIATPCQWLMNKVDQSMLAQVIVQKKVIHNGIDLIRFKPASKIPLKEKYNIPTDAFVLLFAGQATKSNPWKDYETLEKAMIELASHQHQQKIILLCLGEKAQTQQTNQTEIRHLPYEKDETTITNYFQLADLYVHPAKADTLPTAITEALACGTPVIGTKTGGIPEQIRDEKKYKKDATGIVVQEKNHEELAHAIIHLLKNKELRETMSINARKDAEIRFDLNKQAQKYLDWYEEILQEKRCLP